MMASLSWSQPRFIVSPEFQVQVDHNHLIQVRQEAMVERCNEEKVKGESTRSWQVKLYTWLYVWKVCLPSWIQIAHHYCLVDWPMRGVQFVIQGKIGSPKKCFHSRHGVIWNRACENINI